VIIGAINSRDAATVTGNSAAPVLGEGQLAMADAQDSSSAQKSPRLSGRGHTDHSTGIAA
jgi:hypothetical protein